MEEIPNNIQGVRLSSDIVNDLSDAIFRLKADKLFFLYDENTIKYCEPLLGTQSDFKNSSTLVLNSGEENKNLAQVQRVWDFFEEKGAGRNSVLITVGGGMLTDLGGFAASTFKRGMSFINIPTTLLAMVDASVGGKTGINYGGLKNEIGIIRQPQNVLIHAPFLKSLDNENFLSGFAEMLKAALIRDADLWTDLIEYDLKAKSIDNIMPLIWRSVQIKQAIVEIDPEEKGDRRALNFGHTFAHAFESLSLRNQDHIHHGYAVAYGMNCESRLSEIQSGLNGKDYLEIKQFLSRIYGEIPFRQRDITQLIRFMRSDKKNENNKINVTMLKAIGQYSVNNYVDELLLEEVLNRELIN